MGYADVEVWGGVLVAVACAALAVLAAASRTALSAVRRTILIGTCSAAALFTAHAAVVDAVADPDIPADADGPVLSWIVTHRSGGVLTWVMTELSAVGGTAGMTGLAVVAAVLLWCRRRRHEALVVLVAALGAALLVVLAKNLYGRARPPLAVQLVPESTASLPSGHALGSIVVLGVIAVVAARSARSRALRIQAFVTAAAGIVLIGVSRLYLGVHWLTDVLAGWALGGAWLALCITALVVLNRRRTAAAPTTHPDPDLTHSRQFAWFGLR